MQNCLLTENIYLKCDVLIYVSKQIIHSITVHVQDVCHQHAVILACHQ